MNRITKARKAATTLTAKKRKYTPRKKPAGRKLGVTKPESNVVPFAVKISRTLHERLTERYNRKDLTIQTRAFLHNLAGMDAD